MKHLSKLAAILAALVLACAFFGCSDGNSSDEISSVGNSSADESNDQSNGNSSDEYHEVKAISLSDGDYTLKIKQSADGTVEEYDIKATASNESLTFKSGSGTVTQELTAEELKYFEAMSEEEKKAEIKEIMESPDDAEISFDGNKVIIKANLSAAELAEMQPYYKLSSIPSGAKIETNKDNSKYKITVSKEGMQMEFHIKKD